RERPRGVAEELHEPERRTARVVRVEDPHVGASHAGRGELRAARGIGGGAVLAAAWAGDERPAVSAPGGREVPRRGAHGQRARAEAAATRRPRTATTRLTMCSSSRMSVRRAVTAPASAANHDNVKGLVTGKGEVDRTPSAQAVDIHCGNRPPLRAVDGRGYLV